MRQVKTSPSRRGALSLRSRILVVAGCSGGGFVEACQVVTLGRDEMRCIPEKFPSFKLLLCSILSSRPIFIDMLTVFWL